MRFSKLLYFLLVCIFFSCTKIIELELPSHEPQLVMFATWNPDSIFYVEISASIPLRRDSTTLPLIDDAQVEVFLDGVFVEVLNPIGRGIYASSNRLKGISIEVRASHPSFPSIKASQELPPIPKEVGLQLVRTVADPLGDNILSYHADFRISSEQGQFFGLGFIGVSAQGNRFRYGLNSDLPFFEIFMPEGRGFSSKLAVNNVITQRIIYTETGENFVAEKIIATVFTVSQDYYQYLKTAQEQSNYRESFFSEPNPVFSNVENGLGVLGAINMVYIEM